MATNSESILITGAAGFIGAAISKRLLSKGKKVIGIDNMNNYYDVELKKTRIINIEKSLNAENQLWNFYNIPLEDNNKLNDIGKLYSPKIVINLAAQAGVRNSIENPHTYINSNLIGFGNVLEFCRKNSVENFIYASSSSVYGGNKKVPFSEEDAVDHPISLYAATKKANEVMAHSYSHLYKIPSIGLRFFTVYGPWGRPDMAPFIFADAIMRSKTLNVFNYGKMYRDFTYIDDIVDAIEACCYKPAIINKEFNFYNPTPSSSFAPHMIFNVGSDNPIALLDFIKKLENKLGLEAKKNLLPIQPGDVVKTWANIDKLNAWIGYKPKISFDEGISKFAEWFKKYF